MKNMKKLASILLALVMVLSMATTAFAATISVNNVLDGAEYSAYKVFDVTNSGNAYSYTIKSNSDWYDTVSAFAAVAENGLTLVENETVDGVTTYAVTTTEAFTTDKAAELAAALNADETKPAAADTITAADGAANFENLDAGYYFVTTSVGTLCSLNTVTASATVEEKNEAPTVDKQVTNGTTIDTHATSVNVGDTVEFEATITVEAGAINYVYHDTMTTGLTFDNTSVVVKVNDVEVESDTTETKTWHREDSNAQSFDIVFDDAWIAEQVGKTITIEYSATLNENALTTDVETNTANVTYGNDPGTHTTTTVVNEVYDFDIVIDKYEEGDTSKKLPDAEFVLMFDPNPSVEDDEVYYSYDEENDKVVWTTFENADTLTTDANGAATVKGIAAGTYELIETKAPDGYNKLTKSVVVEITAERNEETKTVTITGATSTDDGQYIATSAIANNTGSILPSTGGIGTTIFYVSGAVLAIAAVVFLVTKKRMSGEEE